MRDDQVLMGDALEGAWLHVDALCAVCDLEREWLVRCVEEGLLAAHGETIAEWRFSVAEVARVRRMRALERDFDAVPELAALVADLIEELEALRARLRSAGLA